MTNKFCGPDIVKFFSVESAGNATGSTGDFNVCNGITFIKTLSGCTNNIDINGNTFYNSGNVLFNHPITACTGIYTSNLYGCSPITIHDNLQSVGSSAGGTLSLAFGNNTSTTASYSHAEGRDSSARAVGSHAEGFGTTTLGNYSHAEGFGTTTLGNYSHAEGYQTLTSGFTSNTQGRGTIAYGDYSYAGGFLSKARGNTSFIHSTNSIVLGSRSVVLGGENLTGSTDDTVYVPYLNINNLLNSQAVNNLGIDSNGNVVVGLSDGIYVTGGTYTSSGNTITLTRNDGVEINITGVTGTYVTGGTITSGNTLVLNYNNGLGSASPIELPTLQFTGNTSGDCISDIFVSNIHSCSPLNINPNDEGNVYFGSTSGVTIDVSSGNISANSFTGDGSGLYNLSVSGVSNTFVTGGTYNSGVLTLDRNDGDNVIITGFTTENYYVTGFTYNDANTFTISRNGGLGDLTSTINNVTGLTVNGVLSADSITSPSIQITGGVGQEGTFSWNSEDNTVDLNLNDVTLQLGQELHYHVINQTGEQINNGEVVYVVGVSSDKLSVAPYSISMGVDSDLVLGVATEDIPDTAFGFVTRYGAVRDVNTSGFTVGTVLYALTGSTYTDVAPTPPNQTILLGFVTKEDATEGRITLKVNHERDADEIKVNLSGSSLTSTNVQAALLELNSKKVNVGALSSNIILYPTTGTSVVGGGYLRMVTDTDDPDYDTTPVDVSTGAISNLSGQLIASLASDEGLFVGNPGVINITTLGNIRKVSGNRNAYFYYELYQRDSGGTETLISTSDNTPDITNTSYEEFFASALLNNGIWSATDRVVIKYYGVKASGGGADPVYEFQFGGTEPVRTLLPVPVSVVPSEDADGIQTDTSNFNNILSGADTDVQKALDTLDDHSHTLQEVTDEGNITTDRIIIGDLTVDTNTIYTDGSGNVGIGTTTPSEKLEVNGNTIISGNLGVTGTVNIGTLGTGTSINTLGIDSNGYVVSGNTTSSDSISISYFNVSNGALADGATYYIGQQTTLQTSINAIAHIPLPAGTITEAYIGVYNASTFASGENITVNFLSDGGATSNTLSSTVTATSRHQEFIITGLSISVVAGGTFIEIDTPAFATNPTAVQFRIGIKLEL